ncbi:MAG: DNA cytosine methyltransferase [Pirellulaceae bacterium]|nr:DNA cytosine methyltransferase [Pirellulaceae bacterium]
MPLAQPVRVLELFCGIGGCAAALPARSEVVSAVDIHRRALEVYRLNFPHPTAVRTIESLRDEDFRRWRADFWWLSPPCQPYTRRGRQRDLEDPRAASLRMLIGQIQRQRPRHLALENVPEFRSSQAHRELRQGLQQCGYRVLETQLCATQFGLPARRRRFYLVASLDGMLELRAPACTRLPLSDCLDAEPSPELAVPDELWDKYQAALDVVDSRDATACCACFTSAYGRSPVRSGSYLRTNEGLRRFSPREILRMLGFPAGYRLPEAIATQQAWPLVGNSLCVPAVRHVLGAIPELAETEAPKLPPCSSRQ